jgi:hypothetical protein
MRRMQLDEAVQRADRLGVFVLQILGVALHQLRVHRPGGVRIVLLHQFELDDGGGVALVVQGIDAVVVKLLHRLIVGGGLRGGVVARAAGREQRQQQDGGPQGQLGRLREALGAAEHAERLYHASLAVKSLRRPRGRPAARRAWR